MSSSEVPSGTGDLMLDSKNKLMIEMLGNVFKAADGWSVLVLDEVTTRVLSALVGISDILDYGVSLVENIAKKREPFPLLAGVYFISPTDASADMLISDFQLATMPQYKEAHVFFSSRCPPGVVAKIKGSPNLLRALKTLKEVNLEYVMVDRRVPVTDQEAALVEIFGSGAGNMTYKRAIATCADRLATVFATLREMPAIRYRANVPNPDQVDLVDNNMEFRRVVPHEVAKQLYSQLLEMQKNSTVPSSETCDLIILDRGYDPVAPLIHEWTYEAMVFDLVPPSNFKGKVFLRQAKTGDGRTIVKEHPLDENDAFWSGVRHEHIAVALSTIRTATTEVAAKEAKAQAAGGNAGDVRNMEMRKMRKYMQNLPQYQEMKSQLATHVELATQLNAVMDRFHLRDVGRLEQDVVFGDGSGGREVTQMFQELPNIPSEIKARLLACYLATHLERLDSESKTQWARLGNIQAPDLKAIENLEYLGVPIFRRAKGLGRLKAGVQQLAGKKRRVRKDRDLDEEGDSLALGRFQPLMADILEDLVAGKLSHTEYPNIAGSSAPTAAATPAPSPARVGVLGGRGQLGMGRAAPNSGNATGGNVLGGRGRGARPNWADRASRNNLAADSETNLQQRVKARKVLVFVIGGATRSEMRTAHKLSSKLNRDIFLGSTSLETPQSFMDKLAQLGNPRIQV